MTYRRYVQGRHLPRSTGALPSSDLIRAGQAIGFGLATCGLSMLTLGAGWAAFAQRMPWQIAIGIVLLACFAVALAFGVIEPIAGTEPSVTDAHTETAFAITNIEGANGAPVRIEHRTGVMFSESGYTYAKPLTRRADPRLSDEGQIAFAIERK
jgi:hypothetical protein